MTPEQSKQFIKDIESEGFDYHRWNILMDKDFLTHKEGIELDYYENILRNHDL